MTDINLNGKVAIVTGAASGIGRASAISFAKAGAKVVATDLANTLNDTVDEITANGGEAVAQVMDAGVEDDVKACIKLAQDNFGAPDVFFANAGIAGGIPGFFDATPDQWAEVLRVNLIGPFLAIKHAAPLMAETGGGSIICTASVAGLRAGAGPVAYSASKAGVINLVQSAAQAMSGTNVRVNAICPGLVKTGMTQPIFDFMEQAGTPELLGSSSPANRSASPEELANVALFLASDMASYVNGEALVVDGGMSSAHAGRRRELAYQPPSA